MKQNRLKLRKTRLQLAAEWGISPKTLWGWKTDRWQPSALCQKRLAALQSPFRPRIAINDAMVGGLPGWRDKQEFNN
jgi:DNA-binding XRE family transcriptional regulator